ncbi:MAG: amino acid permease [Chloroflexi bacterium]|nr:amino acid permease [Chloroflexota bacterium]
MGYAQELSRRMSGFSNFAVSFSIICILSGGINSLGQGISGVGGAAIGIGWPIGCLISFIFALGMAQIASAYPTAGGLYHWGSILGGRGWGWATAWLNLIGLVTVLGAINVGTYTFFMGAFGSRLGLSTDGTTWAYYLTQAVFIILITSLQAVINHRGIDLTSKLTDFSGYLIFAVATLLTIVLIVFAPSHDFSRLWTFTNYSGDVGGGVWPATSSTFYLFMLCLLLPIYTITGFDASAHTSEETKAAAVVVPRGIITSVLWSALFGWLLLIAFVIAIPDLKTAAASGWGIFFTVMDAVVPAWLKYILYFGILLSQFLCGLATVTSASRMIFAFSRDGGLPASKFLRVVNMVFRTPVAAIWVAAIISILFTLFTSVYTTIVSVTVIFLFLSYGIPIVLGLFAYGRTWTKMGPWNIGGLYKVIAVLCAAAVLFIFYIGVQPPNDKALWITIIFIALTFALWFGLERKRFAGPPMGAEIERRQREIERVEQALQAGAD